MREVVIAGYLRTAQSRSRPREPERDWLYKLRGDEMMARLMPALMERLRLSPKELDDFIGAPRILVVGCGGAGNNTVNRLYHMGIAGAETIAINTDKQHLDMIQAGKRVLIGKSLTKGLGAGGYPDIGKRAD
jgi:acetyl-CoA acetyltransferase